MLTVSAVHVVVVATAVHAVADVCCCCTHVVAAAIHAVVIIKHTTVPNTKSIFCPLKHLVATSSLETSKSETRKKSRHV